MQICRVGLYTEQLLFAGLLSQHLIIIVKHFSVLFMLLFLRAWAENCQLLQSSKSLLTGLLSGCMQCWLKNHWQVISSNTESTMDNRPLPVSVHTNCISNSGILSNNYDLLLMLSAQVKKWCCKWSHSSSVTSLNCLMRLQKWYRWVGAPLSVKCCCCVQESSWKDSRNFELAHLKKNIIMMIFAIWQLSGLVPTLHIIYIW